MTTVFDSLPEPVRRRATERAAKLGLPATDTFLLTLIEDGTERQAALEALLLEGLESGPPVEVDDAFWAKLREQVRSRNDGKVAM